MSNLKKKLNAIIGDLDKNIKNKEDLDYIKSQIYNISLLFLDEMDKLAEMNLNRINVMAEREKELGHKLSKLERMINNIEKEVFVSPECDFEIICPYCNAEFVEDLSDGTENEVKCPECGNTIEIDWHEEDGCEHGCGGECEGNCEHHCSHEHDDYDEEFDYEEDKNEDEEDDM